jgi:hypothetical protein
VANAPDPKVSTAAGGGTEQTRWPRRSGWLSLSKCQAAAGAGAVTGLLAGIGVSIALGKEIDDDLFKWVVVVTITVLAAAGGMLTGGIAGGCYGQDTSE